MRVHTKATYTQHPDVRHETVHLNDAGYEVLADNFAEKIAMADRLGRFVAPADITEEEFQEAAVGPEPDFTRTRAVPDEAQNRGAPGTSDDSDEEKPPQEKATPTDPVLAASDEPDPMFDEEDAAGNKEGGIPDDAFEDLPEYIIGEGEECSPVENCVIDRLNNPGVCECTVNGTPTEIPPHEDGVACPTETCSSETAKRRRKREGSGAVVTPAPDLW